MDPSASHPAGPVRSFVSDQVGPSFEDLRPAKPATTSTFPVHADLAALLARDGLAHPDPVAAQVLSTAAGYAYSDAGTVAMMMTRMGLERSACREVSRSVDAMLINASAHLVQSQDGRVVVLAFRGTPPLDLISWFLDADVYPETMVAAATSSGEVEPYEVHAGFYRNVRVIRHEIIYALLRALDGRPVIGDTTDPSLSHLPADGAAAARVGGPDAEERAPLEALYVTGHSLGGAMAVIFASMLLMSDNEDYRRLADRLRAVYTFGQPMVGGPEFAAAAQRTFAERDVPLLRYVYQKDPVPLLPPKAVGDYAHLGQELRLADDGEWVPSASSVPMPYVAGLVTSFLSFGLAKLAPLRDAPFRYKIEDHFPHHYVSALVPRGGTDEFGDYYPGRPVATGREGRRA